LPRLFLAMSVSTLLAGYIAPLVTVTLGWAVTTTQRDFRVVLFGLMALLSLVLLMTGSRGGLLGVGIALGAFALCQAIRSPRITAIIAPKVLIGIGVAGLIAASLGFVVLTLPRALGSSNEGRVDMWRSAVEMTADHPVFGVGYGMFGRAFREYRDPTIVQDKLAHAHNLYLNTLSELGVVGTAIVIWLAGTAITRIWRNYRAQIDRRRQMRLEAACCALLGFGAHSLVESFSITPIIFMVLSLLAYVMTPLPESRVVTPPKETRLYTAILLVIVLVWGVGMLIFDSAQNSYMQAFRRQTASEALADVAAAKASDPSLRLYDLVTAFLVDQNTTQPTDAIWVYESVLQLEPTWEIGWANLAALYATNDQPQAAFEAIQRAYALNNSTPALVWWARYADLTKGAPDDKIVKNYVRAMSNAYVLNRVLPVSSFWQETPLSQQALEEFAANVPLDWQYRIWQAQNPSRIAALIPTTPQTSAEWWIVGQEALNTGNATEALTAFETALALLPDNSQRGDYEASRAEALIATNAPQTDIELAIRRAKFYGLWLEEIPTVEGVEEDDAPRSTSINAIEFAAVLYGRPPLFDYSEALDYPDR
jgi:cytochrome c-type biogenesis protein CcmH/NrfG